MVGIFPELDGKTFLLCVGAMRCATSWTALYLDSLPGVAVSPVKEVHFFDAKFPANALGDIATASMKRLQLHAAREGDPVLTLLDSPVFRASVDRAQMIYDDDAYFGHFARLSSPDTAVLCDLTPAYAAIGREGFAYMERFFVERGAALKLLFIMRDPVARLWSQLRHMQAINPEGAVADRWAEAIRSGPIMARADYLATVDGLDATFAADDILYLFYEDLFEETALRRLAAFVGAPCSPAGRKEPINAGALQRELPEEAEAAFRAALAPQYAFCRDRFPGEVPATWLG